MDGEHSRRSLVKYAGAALATTGLAGGVAGHEGDHGPAEPALDAARDAPYVVQSVDKFDWEPNHIVVPTGATVTFLGNAAPHTVTSADTLLDAANCNWNKQGADPEAGGSGKRATTVDSPDAVYNLTLSSADQATITYEGAGQYPFWCLPHCGQKMVGKVVVVDP